jgi:hypothetical protein
MPDPEHCWVASGGLKRQPPRKAKIIERLDKAYVVEYADGVRDRVPLRRVTVIEARKPAAALAPLARTVVATTVRSVAAPPIEKPLPAKRSERYKAFIRTHACFNCAAIGRAQQYPTEADHEGPRAVSRKTSDLLTVPLCTECHRWVTDTYQLPYRFPASKRTLRPREETEAMIVAYQRHLLQKVLGVLDDEAAVEVLEVGLRLLSDAQLGCAIEGKP